MLGLTGVGVLGGCDEAEEPNSAIADDPGSIDGIDGIDGISMEDERGLADADEIESRAGGSCQGFCGSQSSAGCWCDSGCAQYGDCCADKAQVCDSAPPPPPPPPPAPSSDIPNNTYCADVISWPQTSVDFEAQVLVLVNQRRAAGATCPTYGYKAPAPALTMNGALRCAARKHDKDMLANNFFSHTGTGGTTPWQRIASAGYGAYKAAAENIAAGQATPAAVVTGWMNSAGHCKNIMDPALKEIGVGHATGGAYGHYWTQDFASK
ncbi:MAG TPA: CAP domain-containing protein [Nannocystis sp.]